VTFDDAYRGAVNLALPELAKRGLPATVFVPSGLVGSGPFWWDVVADANGGELDQVSRDNLLDTYSGRSEVIVEWASAQWVIRSLPETCLPATETELSNALFGADVTLGGHTWSHPNLTALEAPVVREELTRSKAWLDERFPDNVLPWFSYPYGLENEMVRASAQEAGYEAAVGITGGWTSHTNTSRYKIPRLSISRDVSRHGFALRLAGLVQR
jgi:peptidoglycan/xylan/chitin deacetylase (PgdA/CDA1 family)